MSYSRFSDGDAYILRTLDGVFCCMGCRLRPLDGWYGDFTCCTQAEMLDHVGDHLRAGHSIPDHAIERLKEESGIVVWVP